MLRTILRVRQVARRRLQYWRLGITEYPPNYAFRGLHAADVVIDVGTGNDPDFSRLMISRYQAECFGVDPTRKHAEALRRFEAENPLFHYLAYALGPATTTTTFYESAVNVSGSLLQTHRNVVADPVTEYEVKMVAWDSLLRMVNREFIALVKMDLEGAEYDVINSLGPDSLRCVGQLLVEFHHDTVAGIEWKDTEEAIRSLESHGLRSLLFNGRDCLFYR